MKIIDLFEPKLPPINLLCLPSAYWFYRRRESKPIAACDIAYKPLTVPKDFPSRMDRIKGER